MNDIITRLLWARFPRQILNYILNTIFFYRGHLLFSPTGDCVGIFLAIRKVWVVGRSWELKIGAFYDDLLFRLNSLTSIFHFFVKVVKICYFWRGLQRKQGIFLLIYLQNLLLISVQRAHIVFLRSVIGFVPFVSLNFQNLLFLS